MYDIKLYQLVRFRIKQLPVVHAGFNFWSELSYKYITIETICLQLNIPSYLCTHI